jgi:hypothetical protein
MYSLFITQNKGAWDSRSYEFSRERFLQTEYTTEWIRNQFLSLSAEVVPQLLQFPVLFMYEGLSGDVRVGYLRNIVDRPERGTISIEFDFEWGIAAIPFSHIEPLRSALHLGNAWELRTTHWAIKDADLFRVLANGGITVSAGTGGMPSTPSTTARATPRGATLAEEAGLPLLLAALRRLGGGGLRPLFKRRRGQPALEIVDEYGMQDAVEATLRTLYTDVRPEEPTQTSAGSHSRIDLHVRSQMLAIEVKVTRPGRAEDAIKGEILRDLHDYQYHPHVRTVIVAVYDLASTFRNPVGFENDLTGRHNNLDVIVLVISWAAI